MPQVSPMDWLILMIFWYMLFLMMMIYLYFLFNKMLLLNYKFNKIIFFIKWY